MSSHPMWCDTKIGHGVLAVDTVGSFSCLPTDSPMADALPHPVGAITVRDMVNSGGATHAEQAAAGSSPTTPDETRVLRRVLDVCGRLSAFAAQKSDLSAVADSLAEGTDAEVVILDHSLELLAAAGSEPAELVDDLRQRAGTAGLNTLLAQTARNRRALTMPGPPGRGVVIVAPISVGEQNAGYLLTCGGSDDSVLGDDMRLLATEHAAMVCGVILGRELVITAAAGRARQELVEGLLLASQRDDPEVLRWAQHVGLDETRAYYVLTISPAQTRTHDHRDRDQNYSALEMTLDRLAPDALVTCRADEVVAIVPVDENGGSPSVQGRALANACVTTSGRVVAGIGTPYHGASQVSRSYTEARRALDASQRMDDSGAITLFSEMGIHRLLVRVVDVNDLWSFADEVLGPLLKEEEHTGMEYLHTLSVYFHENSSPRRTAERLLVHPNTVSYRIRRVEEITGLSLDVHRERLMAEVAVSVLEGFGKDRR